MTTMKKDDHTQVISHVLDNFQKYRTDVQYGTYCTASEGCRRTVTLTDTHSMEKEARRLFDISEACCGTDGGWTTGGMSPPPRTVRKRRKKKS